MTQPMPRAATLTDSDHANMDAYFGVVLDAYVAGHLNKAQAVEQLAQAIAEVDTGRYGEVRYRFREGRKRLQAAAAPGAPTPAAAAAAPVPPAGADDFALSQNETLTELLATNNEARLNELVNIARKTVAAGGTFELIETYNGLRHTLLAGFTTSAQVEAWVNDLNKARAQLGQAKLG